jgi:Domain of unknown function (DUF4349)/Putative zinc-finger
MMLTAIHPFSEEEIMAYLDGELSPERALIAVQHLEQCRECQSLAADLRNLSQKFMDWEVEPGTSRLPELKPRISEKLRMGVWKRSSLWAAGLVVVGLIAVVPARLDRKVEKRIRAVPELPYRSNAMPQLEQSFGQSGVIGGIVTDVPGSPAPPPPTLPVGPLIVRTAQLTVTSKHFDQSHIEVERITRMHQGYIAQLELTTPSSAARTLNAMLRVPASQLDLVLPELKRLGRVNSESQRGDDVTGHYVDVNARLANLRTTEQRLLQMLRERAGKLADVLQVEEAVDRTRGEIETTEAEQKMLSNQIAFATVQLSVSEEYQTPLEGNDTSTLIRLRNAAVDGYRSAVDGVIAALAFLLSAAPGSAIVVAIVFFPARWLWRRSRRGPLAP